MSRPEAICEVPSAQNISIEISKSHLLASFKTCVFSLFSFRSRLGCTIAGMDVAASSSAIAVPSAASPSQLKRNKPFAPICRSSTRSACTTLDCTAAHFARSITPYTELALGDCSYLNTCHRRFDSCRYVHWALEAPEPSFVPVALPEPNTELDTSTESRTVLPEQWLNVDLRSFDVSVLGKFDVITADPPWAIHQDLPCASLLLYLRDSLAETDYLIPCRR